MNIAARNQYLEALIRKKGYFNLSKKEKTKLLDEYCNLTGQNRNYVIRKIKNKGYLKTNLKRKRRNNIYGENIIKAIIAIWKALDYPSSNQLKLFLNNNLDRLRATGQIKCSDASAQKLKSIAASTINLKLRTERAKRAYILSAHKKKNKNLNLI